MYSCEPLKQSIRWSIHIAPPRKANTHPMPPAFLKYLQSLSLAELRASPSLVTKHNTNIQVHEMDRKQNEGVREQIQRGVQQFCSGINPAGRN
jgi:hypothetical protein